MKMRLTQRVVDGVKPGRPAFIWDEDLSRFGLRINRRDVKYVVDIFRGPRRRRKDIGRTDLLRFAAARDRAGEILLAAKRGIDLTVDDKRAVTTFGQAWAEMLELDKLRCSPATIADYEDRAERLILPKIGKKLVADVTQADVERLIAATPGARNKDYIKALVRKTIRFAIRSSYLPETHRDPTSSIKVKRSGVRTARALETEDLAKFGGALAQMEAQGAVSPWLANLFRLSLICGLRPGEVRTLTWASVNLPRRRLVVTGKTGEREVHLTDAAVAVLESTPRVQGCEYVFAGRRYGQPIAAVHKMLGKVQAKAGVERFRPYDLRHSAATGALASGADLAAVQALLGHTDLRTTQAYLHASEGRRKAAAERAAAFGRGVLK
jgi:site-specific recombinase XerD